MNVNKIGQATPFIIIGIIVVILVVIVIFISKPTAISGGLSVSQVQPIKNYVDECIKLKMNNLSKDMREFGGYPGASPGKEFRVLTGPNLGIGVDIARNLKDYLEKECKIKEVFDDFSISYKNPDIKVEMGDERIVVNVKWDVTIRKGIGSINLNEFNYIEENDINYINRVIVSDIINSKLENGGDSLSDWIGKDRVVEYFSDGGNIIIEDKPPNNLIYNIKTKFSKERGLNDFRFAVEK